MKPVQDKKVGKFVKGIILLELLNHLQAAGVNVPQLSQFKYPLAGRDKLAILRNNEEEAHELDVQFDNLEILKGLKLKENFKGLPETIGVLELYVYYNKQLGNEKVEPSNNVPTRVTDLNLKKLVSDQLERLILQTLARQTIWEGKTTVQDGESPSICIDIKEVPQEFVNEALNFNFIEKRQRLSEVAFASVLRLSATTKFTVFRDYTKQTFKQHFKQLKEEATASNIQLLVFQTKLIEGYHEEVIRCEETVREFNDTVFEIRLKALFAKTSYFEPTFNTILSAFPKAVKAELSKLPQGKLNAEEYANSQEKAVANFKKELHNLWVGDDIGLTSFLSEFVNITKLLISIQAEQCN